MALDSQAPFAQLVMLNENTTAMIVYTNGSKSSMCDCKDDLIIQARDGLNGRKMTTSEFSDLLARIFNSPLPRSKAKKSA